MKLEVGKSYRTRDGKRALLTQHNPLAPYPYKGTLDDGVGYTWTEQGRYLLACPTAMDLVAEWEEEGNADGGVRNAEKVPMPAAYPPVFWVVWRENGGVPVMKHTSRSAAVAEAARISKKQMASVYVLQAEAVLQMPPVPEPTLTPLLPEGGAK